MAKNAGLGGVFQVTISSVLTTIAQVTDIQGPELEADTYDVTSHDSTSGWEEHVPGVKRTGSVTLDFVFDPAGTTHKWLHNNIGADASAMKITWPDSAPTSWTFSGIVTGFRLGDPHDGALTGSATVKLTGVPTLPA